MYTCICIYGKLYSQNRDRQVTRARHALTSERILDYVCMTKYVSGELIRTNSWKNGQTLARHLNVDVSLNLIVYSWDISIDYIVFYYLFCIMHIGRTIRSYLIDRAFEFNSYEDFQGNIWLDKSSMKSENRITPSSKRKYRDEVHDNTRYTNSYNISIGISIV